jgi:hypothetical protein
MTFPIVDGWISRGTGSAAAYELLSAHNPERMKGQSKPCWTPFAISTIIVSRTGVGRWTLGLGYGASDSANTRRISGTTRLTSTCSLISRTATSKSWASHWATADDY